MTPAFLGPPHVENAGIDVEVVEVVGAAPAGQRDHQRWESSCRLDLLKVRRKSAEGGRRRVVEQSEEGREGGRVI